LQSSLPEMEPPQESVAVPAPQPQITCGGYNAVENVQKDSSPTAGGDEAAGSPSSRQTQSVCGGGDVHVSYEDGSTYMGQIKDGKRHGHGTWKGRATEYEGQWLDDQQHGHGHQTWADGRRYDGQFKNMRFSGQGRMVWSTVKGTQTYEGSYKDDLKHGAGRLEWADGSIYDGQWVRGQRHGTGLYINVKGEKKAGNWLNDKRERAKASSTRASSKETCSEAPFPEHGTTPCASSAPTCQTLAE